MSAASQYYSVIARVGVPHRHEVEVTVPLVGPAGATGPAGAAGASAWNDITGKPSTFAPSAHASTHHTGGSDPITPAAIGLGATDSVTFEELNIVGAPIVSPFAGEGVVNCNKLSLGTYTVDIGGGTPGDAFGSIVFAANDGNITISGPAGDITTSKSISIPNASGTLALTESADNVFRVVGSADATKKVAFEVDGLTTATTRTLTVPNASGTIALTEDFASPPSIGSTTPAAGSFTTLTANNGTITASAPVLNLSQTWNNSGVTFTGLRFNAAGTSAANSAAASLLADFQVGGTTQASIRRDGRITATEFTVAGAGSLGVGAGWTLVSGKTIVGWANNFVGIGNVDVVLQRDAANTLAQVNGTAAQTFNIYNTSSSSNANHERGFMRWSSNVLQIGTEKGGTGSARALEFQTDGTTRFTIASTGASILGASNLVTVFGATGGGNITLYGSAFGLQPILFRSNIGTYRFALDASASTSNGFVLAADANDIAALRDGTDAQIFRIYNTVSGTNNVNFERANFRWASSEFIIDAEFGGTGTALRGIKLGSATSSLLGFYGVTPVDQPALTADLLDSLQELGLVASGSGDTPLNLSGGTLTAGNLVLTDNDGAQTATFDAQSKLTANQTYDLPNASGTLALTSQLATGSTDNAILRADGTGGAQMQGSNLTISDDIREFTFSGVGSTDVITATGHNFTTNQLVRVRGLSGGSGLFGQNNYFVRDISGDTFKVSLTSGGSAVNINDCTGIISAVHPTVGIVNASAGANSSLLLTPKGDAGLILGPAPDGTTSGGNPRGTYSVDLQIFRTDAPQVSSGTHSIILAGQRNTASSNQAIAGGFQSTSSGDTSIALGATCTASGAQSVALGSSCNASGAQATALCNSSLADRLSLFAHAAGNFSAAGDAQRIRAVLRCKTTTNAAVEMALNGTTTYLTIPSGKVMFCNIKVVGVKSDGSVVATYERQYAAKNVAGTSSEVSAPVTIGTDNASSTSLEIATVDAGDYIRIRPTGIASETWRWVASVDAVEVAYGS